MATNEFSSNSSSSSSLMEFCPLLLTDLACNGGDVKIVEDIDSILISCTSLEPFKSRYRFQLLVGDGVKVTPCQNVKYTKYLDKRDQIFSHLQENHRAPLSSSTSSSHLRRFRGEAWYEARPFTQMKGGTNFNW